MDNDELTPMRQFWEVVGTYTEDVKACLNALEAAEENDPPRAATWRRLLANAILTLVNTIPFRLMIYSEIRKADGDKDVLLQRLAELCTKAQQGLSTGPQREAGGLVRTIEISFQAYAELHQADYQLNLSDADVALLNSVGTLDLKMKLARQPSDLDVSDDELEMLYQAVGWIRTNWVDLLNRCGQGMLLDDSIPYVM
jgi:hypothetical protein